MDQRIWSTAPEDEAQQRSAYGVVIAGHFYEDDSYATERPQGREDWLLVYTVSGRGYFEGPEGGRLHCESGDVVLLRPGTPQRYGTVKGETWQLVWAHFSARRLEESLLPAEPLTVQSLEKGPVRKRVYRAMRSIIADQRERGDYWQELSLGALREILMLLAQRRRHRYDPRIEEALHYLSEHMREPIRIETMARHIGLSPSRLSHMFKEAVGLSIIDALNRMRIRQATLFLEHTDLTASEVAYEVGFHNYNHFILQFKKWHRLTPTEYRSKLRAP
ncbi:helix-turn-helix domain-containing protein [Paenibacillus sp. 598K]|uniref:helix-turn-helix domain-containing protein n=1 Tax=Paenibacillus sp. 598K TaxID=1117987 RepID=UPI000FFF178D|nr:helix-turn-helix domain-containing protein [Paenibacillus sp. 598K]